MIFSQKNFEIEDMLRKPLYEKKLKMIAESKPHPTVVLKFASKGKG
jgi:hypothetical protein